MKGKKTTVALAFLIVILVGVIGVRYSEISGKSPIQVSQKSSQVKNVTKAEEKSNKKSDNEKENKNLKKTEITITCWGDYMNHITQIRQAKATNYDFTDSFAVIKDIVGKSDLSIVNLETTIAKNASDMSGYPEFATHERLKPQSNKDIDLSNFDMDTPLSEKEKELVKLINDYRISLGKRPLNVSKSLTYVARTHNKDQVLHFENNLKDDKGRPANMHSWSKYGNWTPIMYNKYGSRRPIWDKPKELTPYKSEGSEISAGKQYYDQVYQITSRKAIEYYYDFEYRADDVAINQKVRREINNNFKKRDKSGKLHWGDLTKLQRDKLIFIYLKDYLLKHITNSDKKKRIENDINQDRKDALIHVSEFIELNDTMIELIWNGFENLNGGNTCVWKQIDVYL